MSDLELRIVSKGATDEEIAAVTAVLQAALDEAAQSLDAEAPPARTAWDRGRRSMRTPVHPAPGAWRGFAG